MEIEVGRGKVELDLGDRIIYTVFGEDGLREGQVEEISPTGRYLKINQEWHHVYDIEVKEIL